MSERILPAAYDALNTALFLTAGGSGRLRQALVDALDVRPGHRVLELGCGTGQVTKRLEAAGADVLAVDALPGMMRRAHRRAPATKLVTGDVLSAEVGSGYDRVVLSFLLHNFDEEGRVRLLRRASSALVDGGRIGILDWRAPDGHVRAALWRSLLRAIEPSPTVAEIVDGALDRDIPAAGLSVHTDRAVVGGRARILIVERASRARPPTSPVITPR